MAKEFSRQFTGIVLLKGWLFSEWTLAPGVTRPHSAVRVVSRIRDWAIMFEGVLCQSGKGYVFFLRSHLSWTAGEKFCPLSQVPSGSSCRTFCGLSTVLHVPACDVSLHSTFLFFSSTEQPQKRIIERSHPPTKRNRPSAPRCGHACQILQYLPHSSRHLILSISINLSASKIPPVRRYKIPYSDCKTTRPRHSVLATSLTPWQMVVNTERDQI